MGRVADDRSHPAAVVTRVDEGGSLDAIPALPADGKRGIGFLDVGRLALAVSGQPGREPMSCAGCSRCGRVICCAFG
jgi:hypothetical protein